MVLKSFKTEGSLILKSIVIRHVSTLKLAGSIAGYDERKYRSLSFNSGK